MKVHCTPELFNRFPTASFHGVVFEQLQLLDEETAQRWKDQALLHVRESNIQPESLVDVLEIKEWRNAFQTFGLKPSKYHSSIEQLYRRALKGNIIQTQLSLVNLYCYVSVIHRTPMGGYDLQKTSEDIAIRTALAGEEFVAIGEKQAIKSQEGIVVYSDQEGIICWGWNHHDSARTCLNTDTQRAIFFADSATENTRPGAEKAIDTLSEILSNSGCVKVKAFVIDRHNYEVSLSI